MMASPQVEHGGQFFAHAQLRGLTPEQALHQLIDLSASINPNAPRFIANLNPALWRHYPALQDTPLLRTLADKFQLDACHIRLTNGISSAILALFAHLRPANTVLYTPIYSEYQRAAQIYSGQVIEIQRSLNAANQQACLTALLSQPVAKNSLVVWVNPATPDGRYWTPNQLRPLLQHWRQQNCTVIIDESFLPFIGFDPALSLRSQLASWPKLIILQSLTKYYACPGLRIGAVFAQGDFLNAWPQPAWPISLFDSHILQQALADATFDADNLAWLSAARADLISQLQNSPRIKQIYPSQANFVLVQTRQAAKTICQALQNDNILLRSCDSFGLDNDHIRIAVHTPAVHQRLIDALNRIKPKPAHRAADAAI
jgi:threonine-phosphate decarboxylase